MTAQASERLNFEGQETWMATEPLSQYLKTRNDRKFISPSTACWRGYFGHWEIKDNKLYLIALKAFIEGYDEVGLDYLFPGKEIVFANWFSGEIRIPKGEILDYVHMGYASLYERDILLVIKNGTIINQYEVDNEAKYQERLKQKELDKTERISKQKINDRKDTTIAIIAITLLVLIFIGTGIGVFHLIKMDTTLSYFIAFTIITPLILIFAGLISFILKKGKNKKKEDKTIAFIGVNFLAFLLICISIGVFYLIKWGTILAYFISAIIIVGVLYLIFLAIKNRMKNK